jgi:hypothetical protein
MEPARLFFRSFTAASPPVFLVFYFTNTLCSFAYLPPGGLLPANTR